ncbi:MAG: alpha/beta hydrolase [Gordonia sp. (in: high G+C Gram-positive bacteria)]
MIGTRHGSAARRAGDRVDGGSYLDIDGQLLWHFEAGDRLGHPTVLLHGAFASAATWGAQIADFVDAGLHLFIPERSGHGHSPDRPGAYCFADMASQIISYLEQVVRGPAHLVGWSDGGVLALLVGLQRPDLVSRIVSVCNYVNLEGADDDAADFFRRVERRDPSIVEFLRAGFVDAAPAGLAEFDTIYDKTLTFLQHEPTYPVTDFAAVSAPTLIVAADRGVTHLDHSAAVAQAIPNGRFAVLPGTHILPAESPELFNPLVLSFLAADPPSQWFM